MSVLRFRLGAVFEAVALAATVFTLAVAAFPHATSTDKTKGVSTERRAMEPRAPLSIVIRHRPNERLRIVAYVWTSCPACEASVGFYRKLVERATGQDAVRVLFVAAEPNDLLERWLADHHLTPVETVERPSAVADGVLAFRDRSDWK